MGVGGQGQVGIEAHQGHLDLAVQPVPSVLQGHDGMVGGRVAAGGRHGDGRTPGNALASPPMLAWLDLEMTGLDPARDVILEIATLVTDDGLEIVAEGPDIVVSAPGAALAGMEKVVQAMHARSGLLAAV